MLPCGHTGDALRGWSHLHRSPHRYPLSFLSRYGSALAELNSSLSPRSARWRVRKSYRQVDPLGFRPGQAHVLHPQGKPQHLGSKNYQSRDTLRSAPLSPIPDRLFRAHPRQSTQSAFSCRFYPTHAKNYYSHPKHMHREAQRIYTLIYIYSCGAIKDKIIKEGSARFIIIMHLK
jgi:hypothetical protein